MTQALTPEEKVDQLLTLRQRIDAELRDTLARIKQEKVKRSRLVVPECGTESGYQRHHHRGETCEECKAAHRLHGRIQYARRKLEQEAS